MAKIKSYPLNTEITDISTGRSGTITHIAYEDGKRLSYLFQPKGLNQETFLPLKRVYLPEGRIKTTTPKEEVDVPIEILNTEVKDKTTGYAGIATEIIRLVNGCVHVTVQANQTTKDGEIVKPCEFSILQLEGPAIRPLSKKEIKKEKEERPSPVEDDTPRHPFGKD